MFIEFVTVLLLFFFFFEPQSMWDLCSLTRVRTHTPCVGRWSHSHWISREVPNVTPNISIKVILDILQNFAMLSQQYGKGSACHAGDLGWIPGSERYSGEGNGYPLQYSCLENLTDRGACRVTVYWIAKSGTRLSDFHVHFQCQKNFKLYWSSN